MKKGIIVEDNGNDLNALLEFNSESDREALKNQMSQSRKNEMLYKMSEKSGIF
jgi:hypothetical protein